MVEISTTERVSASGLARELPEVPCRVIGPDRDGTTRVRAEGIDKATLRSAIDAHDADFAPQPSSEPEPEPEDDPRPASRRQVLAALQAAGLTRPQIAAAKDALRG